MAEPPSDERCAPCEEGSTTTFCLTSKVYPLMVSDDMLSYPNLIQGSLDLTTIPYEPFMDVANSSMVLLSGELRHIIQEYLIPLEILDAPITLISGVLESIVRVYSTTEMTNSVLTLTSGVLEKVVQQYIPEQEQLDSSITLTSGVLEPK